MTIDQAFKAQLLTLIETDPDIRAAIDGLKRHTPDELRARVGMTVQDVAHAAGISVDTIYKLEQGKRKLGDSRVQQSMRRIAAAMGIEPIEYVRAVRGAQ